MEMSRQNEVPGREGDGEKSEMAKCDQQAIAQMCLLKCNAAGEPFTSSLKDRAVLRQDST